MTYTNSASSHVVSSARSLLIAALVAGVLVRVQTGSRAGRQSGLRGHDERARHDDDYPAVDGVRGAGSCGAHTFRCRTAVPRDAVGDRRGRIEVPRLHQGSNRREADTPRCILALNASAAPETKLFFQDMGCDGLNRDGEQVDVMYMTRPAGKCCSTDRAKSAGCRRMSIPRSSAPPRPSTTRSSRSFSMAYARRRRPGARNRLMSGSQVARPSPGCGRLSRLSTDNGDVPLDPRGNAESSRDLLSPIVDDSRVRTAQRSRTTSLPLAAPPWQLRFDRAGGASCT